MNLYVSFVNATTLSFSEWGQFECFFQGLGQIEAKTRHTDGMFREPSESRIDHGSCAQAGNRNRNDATQSYEPSTQLPNENITLLRQHGAYNIDPTKLDDATEANATIQRPMSTRPQRKQTHKSHHAETCSFTQEVHGHSMQMSFTSHSPANQDNKLFTRRLLHQHHHLKTQAAPMTNYNNNTTKQTHDNATHKGNNATETSATTAMATPV